MKAEETETNFICKAISLQDEAIFMRYDKRT